mmetsp:Transcript_2411/g.8340  ORF Transcript_2411/g.8340 Transcript_2411/m.8340 type:complete len:445 (+) Transcript_2411:643-1977(+)
MSFLVCEILISPSNPTLLSFLSLVSCPLALPGMELRKMKALSTLNPSTPLSWSHPCASTIGRTIHWLVGSRNRYRCALLAPSKEGGRAGSGAGTATCFGGMLGSCLSFGTSYGDGAPSTTSLASSYSSSSPPPMSFLGFLDVIREDNRNGNGGTFCCCAAAFAALAFCSCRLSNPFASVRILLAKQSNNSCGIHTWPLGSTRSPSLLVRHKGWFSASATGFMRRASPAACRIVCCTKCERWAKYISYEMGWPFWPSGGADEPCVNTTMALNQTAAPNADVIVFRSGRSPPSTRDTWSILSKYNTMSGLCFFVNRLASAMTRALYAMSADEGCKPGVSISRSVMPCILCVTTRTLVVSVLNAFAATESAPPKRLLIVLLFPTPDLPSSRMVHVNPRSDDVPSRCSALSANATARSNVLALPRPVPVPGAGAAFLPLFSCSANSSR